MSDTSFENGLPASALPSLDWLIYPTSRETFFVENWERRTLVVNREQPAYFASLLSLDEVDRVLTTLDRRYPDVTLKNARCAVTAEDYTTDGEVLDIARVCQLFAEGATITLAYLDAVLPALTQFCRSLESEFSCPFQTNVYLTPPGAQGAKSHYDTHDVFVLQVAGSKRWTIYGTPLELPLPGQDFDPAVHEPGAPTLEFELKAGDVAYVPRGVVHDARSTDATSLHVTAGCLRYTWADLLLEFVAGASLNDPAFRKALPPGFARSEFDRAAARETLRGLLQRAAERGNFDAALDHFVDEFLADCPPPLRGQLSQIAALDGLTVRSVARVRPGAIWRIQADGDSVVVQCNGRRIQFPGHAEEGVRYALGQANFAIGDLPENLDDASKLTIVQRLVREGLVMVLAT